MEDSIKTLYYRGKLKSCNYECGYCPFRKKKASREELAEDRNALYQFKEWITSDKGRKIKNIMFLPYGEALVLPYYQEMISELAKCAQIENIGCQTNLSFSTEEFIKLFNEKEQLRKIHLWCSFHPTQIGVNDFLSQCERLSREEMTYCVGAVGDTRNIELLKKLKSSLPEKVSFWINGMDGRKREYKDGDIEAFTSLDPFFPLELKERKSEILKCSGGRTRLFVNGDGDLFSCKLSRIKIGNLYSTEFYERKCASARCSCYLAYSHRCDIRELGFSEASRIFRLTSKI